MEIIIFLLRKLPSDIKIEWVILETESMVKEGNNSFSNSELYFVSEMLSTKNKHYDIVLAIGALQYFEKPKEFIRQLG